jgi:Tol biopolymer transport system component
MNAVKQYGKDNVNVRRNNTESASDPLDQTLIRRELAKILASPLFVQSDRLSRFLQFIVEAVLSREGGHLKESVIGIEVYHRSTDYDPRIDPIVRTEARRLRTKLQQYYDSEGQHSSVVIRLPSGGYVPKFEIRPDLDRTQVPIVESREGKRKRSEKRALVIGFVAVLVLTGATVAWVLVHRTAEPDGSATITPVANYPGYEFDPSLSPDGKEVAFVWNKTPGDYDIYAKLIGTEPVLQLTKSRSPVHDVYPAWSPDGRYIAFLRISPQKKEVYVVPALGGPERFVCQSAASHPAWEQDASIMGISAGPTWHPDGKSLAITDNEHQGPDSIYLVSVDSGTKKKLSSPVTTDIGDYFPAFSPDGRYLAFVRATSQRWINDIYIQPLPSGTMRRVTFDQKTISGLAWVSDDRLAFSSNRAGSNTLWTIPIHGGAPQAIEAAGWNATKPAALPSQHKLIYTRSFRITDIWRLALPGVQDQHPSPRVEVIGSQGENDSAQFSPDGKQIAFISDRSGTRQLWVSNADGTGAAELTHSRGLPVGTPRWSPDSREIAYDSVDNGHSVIYIVSAAGGFSQLFAASNWDDMMPSWSRDGKFIYFLSRRGEKSLQLWKKQVVGGSETLVAKNGDGEALEAAEGTVYYASPRGGIWKIPENGGLPSVVPGLAGIHSSRYLFVNQTGIYFLKNTIPPWAIEHYSFATHRILPVVTLEKSPEFGTPSLSVSPDERWLIYSQLDQSGSEILMINGFR